MRSLVYLILCFSLPCLGAEVLRVGSSQQILAVSQDDQPWKVGDRLCVYEDREEVECGEVTKTTPKLAVVRLDAPSDRVFRGARVRLQGGRNAASKAGRAGAAARKDPRDQIEEPEELLSPPPDVPPRRERRAVRSEPREGFEERSERVERDRPERTERRPAAKLLNSYDKVEGVSTPGWQLSGGISAGFTFFYPMIHFQRALGSYVSLGLMPIYFKAAGSTTSVGAFGGYLTFNYYGNEYFRGFWTQLGVGAYKFSASNSTLEERSTSIAAFGTIGWRGYWDLGLNVGVGAGLQYVQDPKFTVTTVNAVNFQPVLVLDVGVNF